MRNLKRFFAVLVVVAMMVTAVVPAFAAAEYKNTEAAEKLNAIGLYKGISNDEFNPDLGTALNRETGVVMLLRMFGLEKAAEDMTDEEVNAALAKFTDADKISGWAKNHVAYAVKNGLVVGNTATTFAPAAALEGKAYCVLILRQLGYTDADYQTAPALLAEQGGLTEEAAAEYTAKLAIIKDDLVGISFGALQAEDKDGKKVIENLVEQGVVDEKAAEEAGVIVVTPPPSEVKALDVKSASSLSSKVVEVTLDTAAAAADAVASNVKVKDAAGKEIAVKAVEMAGYNTENKAVIVTLEADTSAGTLYTLTSGTKSVNFGGKAKEDTKPTVTGMTANDYNEVKVTFSEPVKLEGASFVLAEKYGTKAALEVKAVKYGANNEMIITTADQKASTLYGSVITGVADFAGNTMDKDEARTFAGMVKNADALVVKAAASNNANEAVVEFNVNVDPATVAAAAFKVEEMYGSKTVMNVTAARMATKDDQNVAGTANLTDTTAKKHVVLTIENLKDSTLYKVTVTGLKSVYGKDMSTTSADTYKSFVGKAKPTTVLELAVPAVTVNSNTEIKVSFARKLDKTTAENVANYAIAEAYGSKAALAVSKAELMSGDKDVKLTVAAMSNNLYKLTVTNVKDAYGNAIKTADSKNVVSFAGKAVAAKITKIASITRNTDTTITVKFDQSVGKSAADVAHYTMDNNVGYAEKAETTTVADEVKLTIPKTTVNKIYKLTVKGLENADGVAMDAAGVEATFVGQGNAATLPEIQAAVATDNQTLKIYFDRDVTDDKIAGPIWNKDAKVLVANAISYMNGDPVTTTDLHGTEYAYQDVDNKNVLVVRIGTDNAFKAANVEKADNAFKLVGATAKFATDKNTLLFASNENEPTAIVVDAVSALNKDAVRVYFNQPVYGNFTGFATIGTSSSAGTITLSNPVAADSTKKVYDFKLSSSLSQTAGYWLIVNPDVTTAAVSDSEVGSKFVTMKDEDDNTAKIQQVREFAGNTNTASDIKEIWAAMKDEKTLVIYYPELMNTTAEASNNGASKSAIDMDNYSIVNAAGAAVTMSDDAGFDYADIGEVVYSNTDNSVTITFNKTIKTAEGGAFLKIDKATENAVGTATVNDAGAVISKQIAINTVESAKVKISSVSYEAGKITVELSQKATVNTANILNVFDITLGGTTTKLTGLGDGSFALKNSDGGAATGTNDVKKIVITLDSGATVTAKTVGKVEMNDVATSVIQGINGNGVDKDSEMTYAQ